MPILSDFSTVFQMVWNLRHGNFPDYWENPDPKQQTKGLILTFYYQFNQDVVLKCEEITKISSKFNKDTVKSANPSDLIFKIR